MGPRGRFVIGGAAALLALAWGPIIPSAMADDPGRLTYAVTLTAVGSTGSASTALPVPAGLVPVTLTGTVTAEADSDGIVTVRAGTSFVELPADVGGDFSLPLSLDDVVDSRIVVTITNDLDPTSDNCRFDTSTTELVTDLAIDVTGVATPPSTIAEFFSPDVRSVAIVVPDASTPKVNEAALSAVAALGSRYSRATTTIVVTTAAERGLLPTDVDRVIWIAAADDEALRLEVTNPGIPTLSVVGPASLLPPAATALGSDNLALANLPTADGLVAAGDRPPANTLTLADLGAVSPTLAGWGRMTYFLSIPQSAYGGPVDSFTIHLEGGHTPTPGQNQITATILWNDRLVDSQNLLDDDVYVADVVIDSTLVRRDNSLTIRLDALPASGRCYYDVQAAQLDINGTASTVTARPGQSLPVGFLRFPQTLGHYLPVAFGSGEVTASELTSAGHLVSSLQRASTTQLDVQVVDLDTFSAASYPGLIVGATPEDADRHRAPLRFAPWRTVPEAEVVFSVAVDGAFAALEGFNVAGRDLLLLGGTEPDDQSGVLMSMLAASADADPTGWFALASDLLVGLPGREPVQLSSAALVPQIEVTSEFARIPLWVPITAAVVLVLLGARVVMLRGRTRTITRQRQAIREGPGSWDEDPLSEPDLP